MAIATVKRFLGSPRDWDGKIEELNAWTASAFLAGETDASDEQAKVSTLTLSTKQSEPGHDTIQRRTAADQ
jgi:hypothetical protein